MSSAAIESIDDAELFEICTREARDIRDVGDLKEWTRVRVRPLLPHCALACVHGRTYGVGVSLDYVITVDYPVGHLDDIRNSAGHMDTPLARLWFEQQAPVFFDANYPPAYAPNAWLASFRRHDLRNAAADGMLDPARCIATYFSFHQLPRLDETALRATFKTLTPLMHETFARVIQHHQEGVASSILQYKLLTKREHQIVMYIGHGLSNADIAESLCLSEHTIRNQVSRILEKTGCSNRAALAAAAVQDQESCGIGTKIL